MSRKTKEYIFIALIGPFTILTFPFVTNFMLEICTSSANFVRSLF